jgi:hypothetical protein
MTTDGLGFEDSALTAIYEDFGQRTDYNMSVVVTPIVDGLGFRATVVTSGGEALVAEAADANPAIAQARVIGRALARYEEFQEQMEKLGQLGDE